jgi:hypothetical protein
MKKQRQTETESRNPYDVVDEPDNRENWETFVLKPEEIHIYMWKDAYLGYSSGLGEPRCLAVTMNNKLVDAYAPVDGIKLKKAQFVLYLTILRTGVLQGIAWLNSLGLTWRRPVLEHTLIYSDHVKLADISVLGRFDTSGESLQDRDAPNSRVVGVSSDVHAILLEIRIYLE